MQLMSMPTLFYTVAVHGTFNDGGGEWWWPFRFLMIVFWIAVIAFTVRWIVWGRRRRGHSAMDTARGVLAERYARGEIDADEYRTRSEQLREIRLA
jgi:putative membrane protein